MATRKVIVDYKNVPEEVLQMLADKYPHGYNKAIVKFKNAKGEMVSAVPIETDEISYLVKVSIQLQSMVDNMDSDDLALDEVVGASAKGNFGDDEFDDDEDDNDGFSKDREESLDDNMDEAENIADDSGY